MARSSRSSSRRERFECDQCGRHRDEAGPISRRGLCAGCGEENVRAAVVELEAHRGPTFEHWRRRLLAAFGVGLEEPNG